VKVWKISDDGGELEGVLELYEHETPVISVAINDSNTYVAAGAEDGSLVVWSINCKTRQSTVAFSKLISTAARRFTQPAPSLLSSHPSLSSLHHLYLLSCQAIDFHPLDSFFEYFDQFSNWFLS
jgi:WD40 repeat protein